MTREMSDIRELLHGISELDSNKLALNDSMFNFAPEEIELLPLVNDLRKIYGVMSDNTVNIRRKL